MSSAEKWASNAWGGGAGLCIPHSINLFGFSRWVLSWGLRGCSLQQRAEQDSEAVSMAVCFGLCVCLHSCSIDAPGGHLKESSLAWAGLLKILQGTCRKRSHIVAGANRKQNVQEIQKKSEIGPSPFLFPHSEYESWHHSGKKGEHSWSNTNIQDTVVGRLAEHGWPRKLLFCCCC